MFRGPHSMLSDTQAATTTICKVFAMTLIREVPRGWAELGGGGSMEFGGGGG